MFNVLQINLRAEWTASNDIMTKEQFYNRKGGSTPFDSYVLVGKSEDIKARHEEVEKGGWDAPDIGYINANGISSHNDFIAYINLDHIEQLKEGRFGQNEVNCVSSVHKLALLIQHETLHPKTWFLSGMEGVDSNRHWGDGIMADYDITSGEYDNMTLRILQWLHNF